MEIDEEYKSVYLCKAKGTYLEENKNISPKDHRDSLLFKSSIILLDRPLIL